MLLLIIILILPITIFSQDTEPDPFSFFPSEVGNYWEYEPDDPNANYTIVRDSIAEDGSKYIYYFNPPQYYGANYKIDTSGNVYFLPQFDSKMFYKLTADSGDTWMVNDISPTGGENRVEALVNDTYKAYILGEITDVIDISYYELFNGDTVITETSWHMHRKLLAAGFGLVWQGDGATRPTVLQGCIINGKQYGTVVSVDEEIDIPYEYLLAQNYPNPFNPSTIIEYQLPEAGRVILKVYNILGREVATLIDEFQKAGYKNIEFNASNLSSGVYFYRIQTSNYSQTKKMTFIK